MKNEYTGLLEEITEKLGEFEKTGSGIRFKFCPICNKYSEKNLHFDINPTTGEYMCFVTNKGGHINQLEGFKDLNVHELKKLMPLEEKLKRSPEELKEIFDRGQSVNEEWTKYLLSRGITKKGYGKVGFIGKFNLFMMPITNGKEIVGIKYRGLEKEMLTEKGCSTGYFMNWQTFQERESLILVEGEMDLMSVIESNFNNCVSLPFGASNTKVIDNQREFLLEFKNLIIATDKDEVGEKCKAEIVKKLKGTHLNLLEVDLGTYKDFNEVLMAEGKEAIKEILDRATEIKGVEEIEIVEEVKEMFSLGKSVDNFSKLPPSLKNPEAWKILEHFKPSYKKIGGIFYCKIDNYYVKMGANDFIKYMSVKEKITFSKLLKEELLNIIEFGIGDEPFPKEEESIIAFNDGLLNIYKGEMVEEEDQFIYWRADTTLKEFLGNKSTVWREHFKEKLGEEQTKVLLSFLYLSMLNKHNRFILIYYSSGRDGKGTCMESLGELFSKSRNYGFFKPEVFLSDFNSYNLFMKDVAVIDEVEKIPVATAKQITGNSITQAEKKGVQAIEIKHNLSLVLLSNDIVSMRSFNKAEKSRFILIKHIVDTLEADDRKAEELKENKIELLRLILTVGKDHYHEKKGQIIYHNKEMLEDYEEINNPFEFYIRERYEKGDFKNNWILFPELEVYFLELGMSREWGDLSRRDKGKIVEKVTGEKSKNKTIDGKSSKMVALKRRITNY